MKPRDILWYMFGFPLMWVLLLLYAIFAIPVMIITKKISEDER